jgi:hypothetical protein
MDSPNNQTQQDLSTLTICKIRNVDELTHVWDDLLSTVPPNTDKQEFLGRLLGCINDGIIFLAYDEEKLIGFACACPSNSDTAILLSLPGGNVGIACLGAVMGWARSNNFNRINLSTTHLNGSNFRYLEKTLGFRRSSMTFTMTL